MRSYEAASPVTPWASTLWQRTRADSPLGRRLNIAPVVSPKFPFMGEVLGLGSCDKDYLYAAMDCLRARQERIEDVLAARRLARGTLVPYDVSSATAEGRTCPLGAIGHPKGRGPRSAADCLRAAELPDGIPVAIEVFAGSTGDRRPSRARWTRSRTGSSGA
jgi:hypothetical protein